MTMPVWMLLGFATWTVLLVLGPIGAYRWSRILTRRAGPSEFLSDKVEGADWYRRAMRAHANCVENLPVFVAIVFALHVSGLRGSIVDSIAIAIFGARIAQSLVHVSFVQTNAAVTVRFTFFSVQLLGYLALIFMIVRHAWA